jgi:hypothetical protein
MTKKQYNMTKKECSKSKCWECGATLYCERLSKVGMSPSGKPYFNALQEFEKENVKNA